MCLLSIQGHNKNILGRYVQNSDIYNSTKVNHCIREFENKKYVELKAGRKDRREKSVNLTEEGEKFARSILAPLFDIEEYVCRNISSDRFTEAIETRELFNTLFEKAMEKE